MKLPTTTTTTTTIAISATIDSSVVSSTATNSVITPTVSVIGALLLILILWKIAFRRKKFVFSVNDSINTSLDDIPLQSLYYYCALPNAKIADSKIYEQITTSENCYESPVPILYSIPYVDDTAPGTLSTKSASTNSIVYVDNRNKSTPDVYDLHAFSAQVPFYTQPLQSNDRNVTYDFGCTDSGDITVPTLYSMTNVDDTSENCYESPVPILHSIPYVDDTARESTLTDPIINFGFGFTNDNCLDLTDDEPAYDSPLFV